MNGKPISVLLIDDDPNVRDVFRLAMTYNNFPIMVAQDAETGLNYLQSYQPDVVVIDIFLPGLDGYQTLNRIKREHLAPGSRFVAMTAYYTSDTETEALGKGFDGYLSKPFDPNQLAVFLHQLVDR